MEVSKDHWLIGKRVIARTVPGHLSPIEVYGTVVEVIDGSVAGIYVDRSTENCPDSPNLVWSETWRWNVNFEEITLIEDCIAFAWKTRYNVCPSIQRINVL